eukprot:TRINITY_DN171_c0_g2_i1.p5 TRINITY_DN171_c0_g2~~TRINITY_DN171_c0_g2_i1.p5  ORF type:complete len:133 (+),score=6.29 TRINITY_DN171_c0_g2_i1:1888-2286(+)
MPRQQRCGKESSLKTTGPMHPLTGDTTGFRQAHKITTYLYYPTKNPILTTAAAAALLREEPNAAGRVIISNEGTLLLEVADDIVLGIMRSESQANLRQIRLHRKQQPRHTHLYRRIPPVNEENPWHFYLLNL